MKARQFLVKRWQGHVGEDLRDGEWTVVNTTDQTVVERYIEFRDAARLCRRLNAGTETATRVRYGADPRVDAEFTNKAVCEVCKWHWTPVPAHDHSRVPSYEYLRPATSHNGNWIGEGICPGCEMALWAEFTEVQAHER